MSRLPRPYIPISVRVQVAKRMFDTMTSFPHENGDRNAAVFRSFVDRESWEKSTPKSEQLQTYLRLMYGDMSPALDHDQALVNREKLVELETGKRIKTIIVPKGATVLRYFPDANDPDHLRYRPKPTDADHSHDVKTRIRGDHGQLSDLALARKEKRRVKKQERKKAPKRQRDSKWPKGRKIQSRPFQTRRVK